MSSKIYLLFLIVASVSLAAQCSDVTVPEASAEAMRYYWSGNLLWVIQEAWGLLVPLLFLFTGFSSWLALAAEKWGKRWFFAIAIYLVFFIAIYQLLFFPIDFYAGYIRQHSYALSTQSLGRWFSKEGKEVLVSMISTVACVWIFYLLLKKSPRRWWLYSSFVSIAILFLAMLIKPIWIDPLFNQFGPMQNKKLEKQILSLAAQAGIEDGRVYQVNKSQDTNMLNAYVTGFGSTSRIVLWDTAIEQMTTDQLLFVMGHEMGHYVLHHVWWSLLYFALLSIAIFYLTYRAANWMMGRYQRYFKFRQLHTIASLPLLLFLIGFFSLLSSPLMNWVSRSMEHQADEFGLEITQNNRAAAEAFLVLQQKNLANPRPGEVFKLWRSSHPPLGERIDFANGYCPWEEGKPLRFGKYFQGENYTDRSQ